MKRKTSGTMSFILVALVLFVAVGCLKRSVSSASETLDASIHAKTRVSKLKCIQQGVASWYGKHFKGRETASGEKFDPQAMTAASKKFAMGTELKVVNLENNRDVTVTVNDRGPYVGERIIDMSAAAAKKLGMKESGLADVCVVKAD